MKKKNSGDLATLQSRRFFIVIGMLTLLIIYRLFMLQINGFEQFFHRSLHNRLTLKPLIPERGVILDRNGLLLAGNEVHYDLNARENALDETSLALLKKLINLTDKDIQDWTKRKKNRRKNQSVLLKSDLSREMMNQIASNRFRLNGIDIKARTIRIYPFKDALAPVTGYLSKINEDDTEVTDHPNYRGTEIIGRTGLERSLEQKLHGQTGFQAIETNVRGEQTNTLHESAVHHGETIHSSIDAKLQEFIFKALGKEVGSVVVMDPRNGEILALVSKPSYDPNLFANPSLQSGLKDLQKQKNMPLFNRAVQGQYSQGSIIKPFVAIAGLNEEVINSKTTFHDPGFFQIEGSQNIYRDWYAKGHGEVNAFKAIIVSCDTFFYKLSVKLGIAKIAPMLRRFGFGKATGIELEHEAQGLVPDPVWKKENRHESWYHGDTVITSIGQGFMLSTPLQMAYATSILASKGQIHPPTLLQLLSPQQPLEAITLKYPYHWTYIHKAMEQVIQSTKPYGTGFRFGQDAPYRTAAKTGTVQVYRPKDGKFLPQAQLPRKLRDHATFIAFAPIEKPRFALAIVIEHASSSKASKLARKILDAAILGDYQDQALKQQASS